MDKNVEELVSQLSLEVIKDVAPDELDLYDDIKEEFFKNPNAFLEKDAKKKEKMLGFIGSGIAEQFITMTVLPVMLGIVKYIGDEAVESLKKEGSKYVAKKIEERFEDKASKENKETRISKEKIRELREHAYKNAISLGMDAEKAGIIADSSIGKLTLMTISAENMAWWHSIIRVNTCWLTIF